MHLLKTLRRDLQTDGCPVAAWYCKPLLDSRKELEFGKDAPSYTYVYDWKNSVISYLISEGNGGGVLYVCT